jgi:uncharacterized protein (TIGR03067 family)
VRYMAICVLSACFATTAPADDVKKELDRLQGQWVLERGEAGGQPIEQVELDKAAAYPVTVKGDAWIVKDSLVGDPFRLKLTPGKAPAWFDLTDHMGQTLLGIYRLDGDRWEICVGQAGDPRPTEFKSVAGEKMTYLLVYRRKK